MANHLELDHLDVRDFKGAFAIKKVNHYKTVFTREIAEAVLVREYKHKYPTGSLLNNKDEYRN